AVAPAAAGAATGQALRQLPCPAPGQAADVTLPAVNPPVAISGKPYSISYGSLPLTFTGHRASSGSLCTVISNRGALPVYANIQDPSNSFQVASSVTTATVNFYPADSPVTDVPRCDFSKLQSMSNPLEQLLARYFANTNNCLLTASSHASGDLIARWSIPGFVEHARNQDGPPVYSTRPLTYYVDLGNIPGAAARPASFQDTLQRLETYLHTTLIRNLPMITDIGIIQDPPAHLTITDPMHRTIGLSRGGRISTFPGAGYKEVGNRSFAWILEPVPGTYRVTASGNPGSRFTTDFTVQQFLGHGTSQLVQNTPWQGALPHDGTATRTFSAGDSSVAPVLGARTSASRYGRGDKVPFTLGNSVIPFGPATVTWSFGDGTTATGGTATHRYAASGTYTPTVTVTNALGYSATETLPRVTIEP
ncbi:MAG: PKD domain-containing protein, partial [Nocardiopsaceae bacterium]|nr:PKD domain-containing protein [Nocardiopsaceae bacterium]